MANSSFGIPDTDSIPIFWIRWFSLDGQHFTNPRFPMLQVAPNKGIEAVAVYPVTSNRLTSHSFIATDTDSTLQSDCSQLTIVGVASARVHFII